MSEGFCTYSNAGYPYYRTNDSYFIPYYHSNSTLIEKVLSYIQTIKSSTLIFTHDIEVKTDLPIYQSPATCMGAIQDSLNILLDNLSVEITNRNAVIDYILDHSGFDMSVMYASIRIREEFGNNAEVHLDLKKICEKCQDILVLTVRQKSYDDDIMNRLDNISDEFDTDSNEGSGWLLLTTDFHYAR